jgi:hypothetical protein
MTFRVGQKVVCVDVNGNHTLTLNSVYTVTGVFNKFPSGRPGIFLAEVHEAHNRDPFYAYRFRPIVSRKTDISALKALLVPGAKIRETA